MLQKLGWAGERGSSVRLLRTAGPAWEVEGGGRCPLKKLALEGRRNYSSSAWLPAP